MVQGGSHLRRKVEDSESSMSRVNDFMIATNNNNKGHT